MSLLVSLPYLLRRDLGPYAEDRTPFQFLASQMICVALPSHLSCVPYARGVHPLIFFIYTHPPPGTDPYTKRITALHLYLWRSGPQSGIYMLARVGARVDAGLCKPVRPRAFHCLTHVLVLSQYLYYTVHRPDRIRLRAWSTCNQIWITMCTDMSWRYQDIMQGLIT